MRRAVAIALAGAGLTLTAFLFDAAPLFVPGIAFAILGVGAPLWVLLAAGGSRVRREFDHKRVLEGVAIEATLRVTSGPLRLPSAEAHDPLAPNPIRLPARTRTGTVRIVARFARRGLHRIDSPSLLVRDPLEIASLTRSGGGEAQELLVLPQTFPVNWLDGRAGDRHGIRSALVRTQTLAAVDVDGLRPYQPGTPASRIHWPALARGHGLLERRLRAEGDTRPLVVMDARGSGGRERLDSAVRAAASLALALARAGGCELLLPGQRRPAAIEPDLIAWPAAHARLALVEGGPEARAPGLGGTRARLGAVFYVTPGRLERLPGVASGVARGARVLVAPPADGAPHADGKGAAGARARPSFEVAGCHGYVLADGPGRIAEVSVA